MLTLSGTINVVHEHHPVTMDNLKDRAKTPVKDVFEKPFGSVLSTMQLCSVDLAS